MRICGNQTIDINIDATVSNNVIPKGDGLGAIGDSSITDDGTTIGLGGNAAITGNLTLGGNEIHFGQGTNGAYGGYLNYYGYSSGLTQFRDLTIADGKGATVATFTGSSKTLTVEGPFDHNGTTVGFYGTAPIAKQTGVAVDAASIHAALVALGLITA